MWRVVRCWKGTEVDIVGLRDEIVKTVVTGIEMFNKELDQAQAGDNAGILLRGIAREEVQRGMVIAKVDSITPHKKFKCEVYVLRRDEGGRHKAFFTGYRPQFYIRTMDVTGTIMLPDGVEMVMPGDKRESRCGVDHAGGGWNAVLLSPFAKAV